MEYKVIGFRADASAKIGMGHLMRCLSIASALKERGVKIIFFTNSEQGLQTVTEKGFLCQTLTEHQDMTAELPEMLSLLKEHRVRMLIIDSYRVTGAYTKTLMQHVKIMYLDDIATNLVPADGVINYNIYGDELPYRSYYHKECICMLGSQYAPVKKEFSVQKYKLRNDVQNILITMGGSDALNIAGNLGEVLLKFLPKDITLTIICGKFSPHFTKVKALEHNEKRIRVLTDVKDMWNVMLESDLAVSAAGSTMYELCTIGVPSVCCYYVDNQKMIADAFGNKTSMVNAGDYSKDPKMVLDKIVHAVLELINHFDKRKNLSEEMHCITDGNGAYRIADYLVDILARE